MAPIRFGKEFFRNIVGIIHKLQWFVFSTLKQLTIFDDFKIFPSKSGKGI